MKTNEAFHKLIDEIKDEEVLKGYFQLIRQLNINQTGSLWNTLNQEEKEELLLSYDESINPNNLISHNQVKQQHIKW